jgi:diamine N-acetyltransferase
MFSIEPCRDAHLLAQLNEEVQRLHHVMRPDIFKAWNAESITEAFDKMLNSTAFLAYVAYFEGRAVGYVLLRLSGSAENAFSYALRFIYLDQILVMEEFRGKGIGKALLRQVYDLARQEGIHLVRLDHWTDNAGAKEFFGKNGFRYYNERMEMRVD